MSERSGSRPRAAGFRGIRLVPDRFRTMMFEGVRVTDPQTTWALLARELDLPGLVTVGDILITKSRRAERLCDHVTIDELLETAQRWQRAPGTAALRRAIPRLRAGVDSPMESELRQVIVEGGFSEPTVHPVVVMSDGTRRRPDLGYEELKLGIEYEGIDHANPQRMRDDIARVEDFAEVGWTILRVTVRDIRPTSERLLRRLDAAIERCEKAMLR
ncbi:MAG: hypothetical protein ACTH31_07430 [Pseudoclavibacter sp.]